MAFLDDPANVLFPDKVATGTLPSGKDPRTVPQASNFNDLKEAALELRDGVLARAVLAGTVEVAGLQGFWYGSTPPPDSSWIWIVAGGGVPAQPVGLTAAAALLGVTAVAPAAVNAIGSVTQLAAVAAQLGLVAVAPASVVAVGGAVGVSAVAATLALVPVVPTVAALVAGGGTTLTFETGTEGMTLSNLARSTTSPITGSYSLMYSLTGDIGGGIASATKAVTITNGAVVSLKTKASVSSAGNNDGGVTVGLEVDGAVRNSVSIGPGDGAVKTVSWTSTLPTGAHTLVVRVTMTPNTDSDGALPTDLATWVDDISFS